MLSQLELQIVIFFILEVILNASINNALVLPD